MLQNHHSRWQSDWNVSCAFRCELCMKRFAVKSNFKKHLNRIHIRLNEWIMKIKIKMNGLAYARRTPSPIDTKIHLFSHFSFFHISANVPVNIIKYLSIPIKFYIKTVLKFLSCILIFWIFNRLRLCSIFLSSLSKNDVIRTSWSEQLQKWLEKRRFGT